MTNMEGIVDASLPDASTEQRANSTAQVIQGDSTVNIRDQFFNIGTHLASEVSNLLAFSIAAITLLSLAALWITSATVNSGNIVKSTPRSTDLRNDMWRKVEPYQNRPGLQAELERKLARPSTDIDLLHSVTISGPPGSGKTQLVMDYLSKHEGLWKTQVYLDAETMESLHQSFDRAASKFSLDEKNSIEALKDFLSSKMGSRDTWLVVLDNANDLAMPLHQFIPKGSRGTVVVISTDSRVDKVLSDATPTICVNAFEYEEAVSLLQRFAEAASDCFAEATISVATDLFLDLESFPLAIAMAGARIRDDVSNGQSAKEAMLTFQNDFKKHAAFLSRQPSLGRMSSYQKTMWTIWDSTMELFERNFPHSNSSMLALFLASLNHEANQFSWPTIPSFWFRLAADGLPLLDAAYAPTMSDWLRRILSSNSAGSWDDFSLREAVQPLLRYGFVQETWDIDGVALKQHGLVRWRLSLEIETAEWKTQAQLFTLCISLGIQQDLAQLMFPPEVNLPIRPGVYMYADERQDFPAESQAYSLIVHSAGIIQARDACALYGNYDDITDDGVAFWMHSPDDNVFMSTVWRYGCSKQYGPLLFFQDDLLRHLCDTDWIPNTVDEEIRLLEAIDDEIWFLRRFPQCRTIPTHHLAAGALAQHPMIDLLIASEDQPCNLKLLNRTEKVLCFRKRFALMILHATRSYYEDAEAVGRSITELSKDMVSSYPLNVIAEALEALQRLHLLHGVTGWAAQAGLALLRALWLHGEIFILSQYDLVSSPKSLFLDLCRHAEALHKMNIALIRVFHTIRRSDGARAVLEGSPWKMVNRLTERTMLVYAAALEGDGRYAWARRSRFLAAELTWSMAILKLPTSVRDFCQITIDGKLDLDCLENVDKYVAACLPSFGCCPLLKYDLEPGKCVDWGQAHQERLERRVKVGT
jgi:hypothetical protein